MNTRHLHSEILKEGGCSYSLTYGDVAGKKGYAVSIHKDRETLIPMEDFTTNDVRNFILENTDLLASPDKLVGAWIEKGDVYLDVSIRVTSKAEAERLCRLHGQIAYYDLLNRKTIYI